MILSALRKMYVEDKRTTVSVYLYNTHTHTHTHYSYLPPEFMESNLPTQYIRIMTQRAHF